MLKVSLDTTRANPVISTCFVSDENGENNSNYAYGIGTSLLQIKQIPKSDVATAW